MSRTAVVLVVLAMAGSPDTAILCEMLCAPQADAARPCDHDGAGPTQIAAGGDCCDDMVAGTTTSQVPAMRRDAPAPQGDIAIPALRNHSDRSTPAGHRGYAQRLLPHPPLPTILRI